MRLRVSTGWVVSLVLALVGCGQTRGASGRGGATDDDDDQVMALDFAQSGSRLVALGYSSNEAQVFRTFRDTELGFDCTFVPDAAGEHQRCAPSASATVVYTDAACTELAGWRWGDAPAVEGAVSGIPYVVSDPEPSCPGDAPLHREAYRVGPQLSEEVIGAPAMPLFQLDHSRCQPAAIPAKVTPAVYRLVPLAESELARGDRVSLNVGEGLRLTRLVADDGAALNLGVTSADRTPCALQRDGECVPEPIALPASAFDDKFSEALDADCTRPAFVLPYPAGCGRAKFGVEDDGVRPPKVRALQDANALFGLEIVQPVTDAVSYACTAHSLDQGQRGAAPGRDLTGTLPTAGKLRRGSGPLYVTWYSVGQSELLPALANFRQASPGVVPSAQFVNDAGQSCQVMPADDGTLRCAILDPSTGHPIADWATFPEVVEGPL